MRKFKAAIGTRFTDDQAEEIGLFLTEVFPNGSFTPEQIIEVAKPKSSPIHKYFEWDDKRAAHLYRLKQARQIIQALIIEIDGKDARQFVNVYIETDEKRSYLDIHKARESQSIWSQVLERAMQEAASYKRRYENLKELGPIIEAINKVEKEYKNATN
jgi:hypothetical protein